MNDGLFKEFRTIEERGMMLRPVTRECEDYDDVDVPEEEIRDALKTPLMDTIIDCTNDIEKLLQVIAAIRDVYGFEDAWANRTVSRIERDIGIRRGKKHVAKDELALLEGRATDTCGNRLGRS